MAPGKNYLGKWRSIEFELIFNTFASIATFKEKVKEKPYYKYLTFKYDGSIEPTTHDGVPKEVILTYREGQEKYVQDFCASIKGLAYVNSSCGTHVHFDMRHIDEATALLYGKRLSKVVPVLRSLLPKSRRTNYFCEKDINTLSPVASRYAFVNMQAYNKYKTIEVRGHSGTLNASKILNWIALCNQVMTTDKLLKNKIKNVEALVENYDLSPDIKAYVEKRLDKFKPKVPNVEQEVNP